NPTSARQISMLRETAKRDLVVLMRRLRLSITTPTSLFQGLALYVIDLRPPKVFNQPRRRKVARRFTLRIYLNRL
ncbi:MAG TPA: hypothetical protein VF074_06675, partial [Pyrinomonadaceae bacterium]